MKSGEWGGMEGKWVTSGLVLVGTGAWDASRWCRETDSGLWTAV